MDKIKMSFYDGTLDKEKARQLIQNTNKSLLYRYGYAWKGATTQAINKADALNVLNKSLIDITENDYDILINEFDGNDMF